MADTTDIVVDDEMIDPMTGEITDQKELAERVLAQVKEQDASLTGPGGLLNQLTKNVFETGLEAELAGRFGHECAGTPIAEKYAQWDVDEDGAQRDCACGNRSSLALPPSP